MGPACRRPAKLAVYFVNRFHAALGYRSVYDYETLSTFLAEFGFKDIRCCEMSKSEHDAFWGNASKRLDRGGT